MKRKDYPLSRKSNIVIQDLAEEVLIYDLDANKAFALNPTATMMWRMCDGSRSTTDISREAGRKLKSPMSEDMVWLALNQFKTQGLLEENGKPFVTPFDGMSRREIIKRVGFASAVALPVISSLVAPRAALAQSNSCGPIGNCTGSVGATCVCNPIMQPGNNNNPNGCPCATNGDCAGDCFCANPCTAAPCEGAGEVCQSGICFQGQTSTGVPCNGTCPQGQTCNPDGSCSGVCPPGNNVCIESGSTPICIPGNGGNPDCCPCPDVEDCQNCCNNGVCGPCVG